MLEVGSLQERIIRSNQTQLKIRLSNSARLSIGDSIAVNGVCLTVTTKGRDWFQADIMPTTWRGSNLSGLNRGAAVNLEPALREGDAMGGHWVTGHVDGLGQIAGMQSERNAVLVKVRMPKVIAKQMIPKGSIALG